MKELVAQIKKLYPNLNKCKVNTLERRIRRIVDFYKSYNPEILIKLETHYLKSNELGKNEIKLVDNEDFDNKAKNIYDEGHVIVFGGLLHEYELGNIDFKGRNNFYDYLLMGGRPYEYDN